MALRNGFRKKEVTRARILVPQFGTNFVYFCMYISPQLINRNELLLVYVYKMWEGKQGSRKNKNKNKTKQNKTDKFQWSIFFLELGKKGRVISESLGHQENACSVVSGHDIINIAVCAHPSIERHPDHWVLRHNNLKRKQRILPASAPPKLCR